MIWTPAASSPRSAACWTRPQAGWITSAEGTVPCCSTDARTALPEIDTTPAEPILLAPGDVFLLVTDGFFEWTNEHDEQFGVERIFALLRRHPDLPAADLIDRMHRAVAEFGRQTGQTDDLTAVLIRRL